VSVCVCVHLSGKVGLQKCLLACFAHRQGETVDGSDDDARGESDEESVPLPARRVGYAPRDVALVQFDAKNNVFGLGYKPLSAKVGVRARRCVCVCVLCL
jgi:hypothetical protein